MLCSCTMSGRCIQNILWAVEIKGPDGLVRFVVLKNSLFG